MKLLKSLSLIREIEQWMFHYYQSPNPEFVPKAIKGLSFANKLADKDAVTHNLYFFCSIFRAHPDRIIEWISPLIDSLSLTEKHTIATALWLSDTQDARNNLKQLGGFDHDLKEFIKYLSLEPPPIKIEDRSIENPSILEAIWASFMATGTEKYVFRIISALDAEGTGEIPLDQLKWSLKMMGMSHPLIRSICAARLAQQPPNVAAILEGLSQEWRIQD